MKRIGIAITGFLLVFAFAQGQADSDKSAKVRKSLKEKIGKEMPGWTHRSIEPFEGSQGVIIQQWELGDIIVKIAVTEYPNEEQAVRAFKAFKSHLIIEEKATTKNRGEEFHLIKEDLSTLGDEGFVSDVRGSEAVAFRKGEFLVNVSVPSPQMNKDVFFSRKFAEHVAKALDDQ